MLQLSPLEMMAVSALGVGFLIVCAWAMGFRNEARLASEADVAALLAAQGERAPIANLALDVKGRVALGAFSDGRIFALQAMGDRFSVRVFAREKVRGMRPRANVEGQAGVQVWFQDVGFPEVRLRLAGREAPDWLMRLGRQSA